MNKKRQTCFRNEIRKSLIVHALVPCIVSLLVVILLFLVIGFHQIQQKSAVYGGQTADQITNLINNYQNELDENHDFLTEHLASKDDDQVKVATRIYAFLNQQDVRGDFYLFDAEKNLLFSTQINELIVRNIQNYLSWGARQTESRIRFLYGNSLMETQEDPMWFLFSSLTEGEKIIGYCAFTLPSERFQTILAMQDPSVLIVNRFHRIFIGESGRFSDDRGKLLEIFRNREGYIRNGDKWYYNTARWILDGEIKICTSYDCTFLIQLCSISMVLILILGSIMVVTIYFSAGRVADKKTEILSEVVDALEQVEKGNFDVSMQISTGDEFEKIGQSFNMMLGSIRHLLMRHEELAQENILANMQIMESQFNPHFLFNTLESVRYMINFNPEEAEQMLVSLSRLLRYSIQSAGDEVRLEEEMDFVHRYLQIMLYRYGKRLKFYTDWEDECWDYMMPRMILQPIVENALKYGYSDETNVLEIWIRVHCEQDIIRILVEDNGRGIPEELLAELKINLGRDKNVSNHIGLYNVNKRIKLLYGTAYGVRIHSTRGKGTSVEISIPMQNKEGEQVMQHADACGDCRG